MAVPPERLVDGTRLAAAPKGEAGVSLDRLVGRSLGAGQITLQLNQDRTFHLRASQGGGKVEGTYTLQDGVLTFAEPRGAIGGVEFPMRCRVAQAGETLQLASIGDSCKPLNGLLFR